MIFILILSPINFFVWNIRGASRIDSLRYLKKMVHDYDVKILVLLEPMLDDVILGFVQHFLKFQSASSFVEGKIWILWDLALNIS